VTAFTLDLPTGIGRRAGSSESPTQSGGPSRPLAIHPPPAPKVPTVERRRRHTRVAVGVLRYLLLVPHRDPRPGDAYRASPATSFNGDAHGNNPRPCAVVERLKRVALALGRTTHPEPDARTLESPANPELGFTEFGYWQDRYQRPVSRKFWGTADFVYLGLLPETEAAELTRFWELTNMLGRKGF
jgi:hypothetical protein